MAKKKKFTQIYVKYRTKKALERLSKLENRTQSGMVDFLVRQRLESSAK
jgi:hypothetical protein